MRLGWEWLARTLDAVGAIQNDVWTRIHLEAGRGSAVSAFFFCKPRTGVDFRNNVASLQVLHATACVCPNIGIDAPSTLPWEASRPPRAKVDRSVFESFEGGAIFFLPVSW